MTVPGSFNAFRIHNDAAGYRSGVEQVPLAALSPAALAAFDADPGPDAP